MPMTRTPEAPRQGLSPRTQELWLAAMRARRRTDAIAEKTAQ